MARKILIVLASFFVLFFALAASVPFFVDIDRYRPKLLEIAQEHINGKLELGKLKLSLWGQLRVEVAGLALKDLKGQEILSVKEAYFHLSLLSLFAASPVLTFKMDSPTLKVLREKDEKINLLSIMKEKPEAALAQPAVPSPQVAGKQAEPSGMSPFIAGMVSRAKLGFVLKDADVFYQDQISGMKTEVKALNFVLKNASFKQPTQFELWADLDTQIAQPGKAAILVKGPIRLLGEASIALKDQKWDMIHFLADLNLDDLALQVPGTFEKKKGIPLHSHMDLSIEAKKILVKKLDTQFFNVQLSASGSLVRQLENLSLVDFQVQSNAIEFAPWVELLPALKEFELSGVAVLQAKVHGPTEKLAYEAQLEVKKLKAKSPLFKIQPEIDLTVHVIPDQIEKILMNLRAPGSDLKMQGKITSLFTKPQGVFNISSNAIDLDRWLKFPASEKQTKSAASASSGTASTQQAKVQKANVDQSLDPLRKNPLIQNLFLDLSIDLKSVKANQIKVSDLHCKLMLKNLSFQASPCNLRVFDGTIQSSFHTQLLPAIPSYQFDLKVMGLQLSQAVAAQLEAFKNTLKGKADFFVKGQGASLNTELALKNLKAQGEMKVLEASFSSIDVMKMVSEALSKSVTQVANQVPALKGKTIGKMPNLSAQQGADYDKIATHFTLDRGQFLAPDFVANAKANKGVDLKGKLSLSLLDDSLDASWEVIDTYNLTKVKDLSVEQSGVKVDHILVEGNGPFRFPVHVGCYLKAPCYSYPEVPTFLSKIALANVGRALGAHVQSEGKKKAMQLIEQSVPKDLQKSLKGLFR